MIFPLEGAPNDDQKERLENYLTELMILSRKYRILLDTTEDDLHLVDMDAQTVIGLGLSYLIRSRAGRQRITAYDATGSILDGVWLIDTPQGPQEQRTAGRVWPAHPTKEHP